MCIRDRYTDGDLIINGRSTKEYGDKDWDTYRNHSIGCLLYTSCETKSRASE